MEMHKKFTSMLLIAFTLFLSGCGGSDSSTPAATTNTPATFGETAIVINGVLPTDPKESIYVRKVGHGPKTIVLVPGNNTSGQTFEGM
ncbi:MAG: hypothetical protein ACXU8A_05710, partial [Burkholderiaceae bacterium]